MACVPGTPCFENTVNAYYPQQCNNGGFAGYPIPTTAVVYNGPNLSNTGVDTGDNLTIALQKIDNALEPIELVQTLITVINQNPSLKVMFCTLVNSCAITPTTTTSSSSSTSTTTSTSTSTSTSTTSTTSTSTSTTSTTTTATPTTTTTTTLGPPTEDLNLLSEGNPLCGVTKVWETETPEQVKCDWIELINTPNNSYGGSVYKYYASAGINVGTQLYNTTPGNPPITISGTYVYYSGIGPAINAQIIVVINGIISAIYNLGDLPVCGPYICPTTTTTTTDAPGYIVGEAAEGGIIAYILQSFDPGYDPLVQHGLVVSIPDVSTGAVWGCAGTSISTGIAIGEGNQNTINIIAGCPTAGIAAKLCGDLVESGYSDWYLPSQNELSRIYLNRAIIGVFANAQYWNSTEGGADFAGSMDFSGTGGYVTNKANLYRVKGVRSF